MTKARSIHFLTVPHPNVQAILKFGLHVIKYVGQAREILEESVLFLYILVKIHIVHVQRIEQYNAE